MSDVIMNIILFALIMIPMLFLILRSSGKKELQQFKSLMKNENLNMGKYVILTKQILCTDKTENALCYWIKGSQDFEKVLLAELESAEVMKSAHHGAVTESNIASLQKVEVYLTKKDKMHIILPIYNINENRPIDTDLLDVEGFIKNIKALIKR
jgi:hypothetical protein